MIHRRHCALMTERRAVLTRLANASTDEVSRLQFHLFALEDHIDALEREPERPELRIHFSGSPIVACRGLTVDFVADALKAMQDAIRGAANAAVTKSGRQGAGTSANAALDLLICAMPAGGFHMEAVSKACTNPRRQKVATKAIGVVRRLFTAASLNDADGLTFALRQSPVSVRTAVARFLELLHEHRGRCNLEFSHETVDFENEGKIALALQRMRAFSVPRMAGAAEPASRRVAA